MSGYTLYEGPSLIDGKPIAVIAIDQSKNGKTGGMLQTYIIRSDINPLTASKTGEDFSICGDCKHRGKPTDDPDKKQAKDRPCYVTLGQGPLIVFNAYKAGKYPRARPQDIGKDRDVRIGTYGDPYAAPVKIWEELLRFALGWTGYTHQWRTAASLKDICMASVDSQAERQEASAVGWRTFRITFEGEPLSKGNEVNCPSDKGVQCADCMLCGGSVVKAKSIAIIGHGSGKKYL